MSVEVDHEAASHSRLRAGRWLADAPLALPGAAVVFLSFHGGGFFPTAPAVVALVLAVVLVLQLTLHPDPFGGLNAWVGAAVAGLGLFTVWTLVSVWWSDAPGRAIVEFSRALGYLLALLVFAGPPRTDGRVRLLLWGVLAGIVVVCGIGVVTRTLPEVWPIRPGVLDSRLSYPLTYWNAFGILSAIGAVLAFHLAASEREPPAARIAGAAAVPLLATALFLSFSRGAFGAVVVGVVAYALLARPRGLLGGVLATGPATAAALVAAYGAETVGSDGFASAAGVAEGRTVALVLAGAMAAAALLRALLLRLDARLEGARLPARARRPVLLGGVAAVLVIAVVLPLAAGAPGYAERQYERFKEPPRPVELNRERFLDPSNNFRLDHWRVALDGFDAEPLRGTGAGTYELLWARDRPRGTFTVRDAHSLYLEVMAELGLVGIALLGVALLALLAGAMARSRGPDRALGAAVAAAMLAWGLHAGLDWDWEMPAVTLWVFALGGALLASAAAAGGSRVAPGRTVRVALALGCLVLAVTPALLIRSQTRLDTADRALQTGRCPAAVDAALDSLEALGVRAQPFQILGYCDVRLGLPELAVQAMQQAVRRDPRNWETHYGLALVLGADGRDPRAQARLALALNPQNELARRAATAFGATSDPAEWKRRATRARLPKQ
jgi:hypothetical protein